MIIKKILFDIYLKISENTVSNNIQLNFFKYFIL